MSRARSLYRQLADDFAVSIRDGTLKAGDRIPSVRELSRDRGLSPATVVHAYEVLEAEGFIETRPRSGFYVSDVWQGTSRSPRAPIASRRAP
jgi:DNA-binding transcriptional regulator YhcF (GntR family)